MLADLVGPISSTVVENVVSIFWMGITAGASTRASNVLAEEVQCGYSFLAKMP